MIELLYLLFPEFATECQLPKTGKATKKHSASRVTVEKIDRNVFLRLEMCRRFSKKIEKPKSSRTVVGCFWGMFYRGSMREIRLSLLKILTRLPSSAWGSGFCASQ